MTKTVFIFKNKKIFISLIAALLVLSAIMLVPFIKITYGFDNKIKVNVYDYTLDLSSKNVRLLNGIYNFKVDVLFSKNSDNKKVVIFVKDGVSFKQDLLNTKDIRVLDSRDINSRVLKVNDDTTLVSFNLLLAVDIDNKEIKDGIVIKAYQDNNIIETLNIDILKK